MISARRRICISSQRKRRRSLMELHLHSFMSINRPLLQQPLQLLRSLVAQRNSTQSRKNQHQPANSSLTTRAIRTKQDLLVVANNPPSVVNWPTLARTSKTRTLSHTNTQHSADPSALQTSNANHHANQASSTDRPPRCPMSKWPLPRSSISTQMGVAHPLLALS